MSAVNRAHGVLKHLDNLKPLFELNFTFVKLAYDRLMKYKPDHITLNYYDVLVSDLLKVFPNHHHILSRLVEVLQFQKPLVGLSVMVLDLLTVLCVLTTGSVSEKALILFKWYNFSETGLMDEFEHVNFIMRSTECLKKLKLMGMIDITRDDAKYMALDARIKLEKDGRVNFLPGLYVNDFTRWLQANPECQVLYKFVAVLNRLVDSMLALEARTNSVLHIMEAKKAYKPDRLPVPSIESLPDIRLSSAAVFVVFRNQNLVSISLPLSAVDFGISDIYIKYDKIVESSHETYEIPHTLLKRNKERYRANRKPLLKCCDKTYLLTSYHRQSVFSSRRQHSGVPFQRVDLPGLEPASDYYITVYTRSLQYRTLKVRTLQAPVTASTAAAAAAEELQSLEKEEPEEEEGQQDESKRSQGDASIDESGESNDSNAGAIDDESVEGGSVSSTRSTALPVAGVGADTSIFTNKQQAKKSSLCILPASLTVEEAEMVSNSTDAVLAANTLVFTGTICSIDQNLPKVLQNLDDTGDMITFRDRCRALLLTIAATEYASRWESCVQTLMGICQCESPSLHVHELVTAVLHRQLVLYNASGPWKCPEMKMFLKLLLDGNIQDFDFVRKGVESLYEQYTISLQPPRYTIHDGTTQLFFIRNNNSENNDSSNGNGDDDGISLRGTAITLSAFTRMLFARLQNDAMHSRVPQHLVLLVRDPRDLLEHTATASAASTCASIPSLNTHAGPTLQDSAKSSLLKKENDRLSSEKRPSGQSVNDTTNGHEVKPPPKLTGRYELLHGEYSTGPVRHPSPNVDTTDPLGLLLAEVTAASSGRPSHSSETTGSNSALGTQPNQLPPPHRSEDFDIAWALFLQVALRWLRNGLYSDGDYNIDWKSNVVNLRRITIVSCNWAQGENFEIWAESSGGGPMVSFRHECLLSTRIPSTKAPTTLPSSSKSAAAAATVDSRPKQEVDAFGIELVEEIDNDDNNDGGNDAVRKMKDGSREISGSTGVSESKNDDNGGDLSSSPVAGRDTRRKVPPSVLEAQLLFTDTAMRRFRASLPIENVTLQVQAASALRTFHCESRCDGAVRAPEAPQFPPVNIIRHSTGTAMVAAPSTAAVDAMDSVTSATSDADSSTYDAASSVTAVKVRDREGDGDGPNNMTAAHEWWREVSPVDMANRQGRLFSPPPPQGEALRRKSVEVTAGPYIVRTTHDEGWVRATLVGCGRVFCSLYEVPIHMQYGDLMGVASSAEDRAKLRLVETKTVFCVGQRPVVFLFSQLRAYCCYCVVVDPRSSSSSSSSSQVQPAMAHFRTLGSPHSLVSSILLGPVSAEDYTLQPTARTNRLAAFAAEQCRSPVSAVFCLDYNAAVLRNHSTVGPESRGKSEFYHLGKQCPVVHTLPGPESNLKFGAPYLTHEERIGYSSTGAPSGSDAHGHTNDVYVTTHGRYCYIALRRESSSALRHVIKIIRALQFNSDVKMLVLLVNQPLVRYMRGREDGQQVCDGPMTHHKLFVCLLLMSLLDWKASDETNDCKIICTAPVNHVKCVMIRYARFEGASAGMNDMSTMQYYPSREDVSVTSFPPTAAATGTGTGGVTAGGSYLEIASSAEGGGGDVGGDGQGMGRLGKQGPFFSRSLDHGNRAEFSSLEQIWHAIDVDIGSDIELQNQTAAVLHSANYLNRTHHRHTLTTVEHLVLPIEYHTGKEDEQEEVEETITWPMGRCLIEDLLEYEVLHEVLSNETGVYQVKPRLELYRETLGAQISKVQPLVYRLDFLIRFSKQQMAQLPVLPAPPTLEASLMESSAVSTLPFLNTLHRVYVRPLLHEVDLVEVLLGPVVGKVSADSVSILFEVNMNLTTFQCTLQPLGATDESEYITKTLHNVSGFELLQLDFHGLDPGTNFEIYLPDITFNKRLGKFKTIQPHLSFTQFAVTGSNVLRYHPIIDVILDQLCNQQSANLMEIKLLNDIIAEDEDTARVAVSEGIVSLAMKSTPGYRNTFAKLSDHLSIPGIPTNVVFHLGDIALLSHHWDVLMSTMIDHARRLEIPLRDASLVGQFYFKQIEQVVKDTFRLFWSTPVLQSVLSNVSNVPSFHSHYLLPLSRLENQIEAKQIVDSETDNTLLQIVRRIFENQLHTYVSKLYGWDISAGHHYGTWRSNSLVVVSFDIAIPRRKPKKRLDSAGGGEAQGEEEAEAAEGAAPLEETAGRSRKVSKIGANGLKIDMKDPFTLGFLDRNQWKNMRALSQDRTVTHIVLFTERPILPLTNLPTEYVNPESVPKGEILDWAPTVQDLDLFFKFWFEWLFMHNSGAVSSNRSLVLVSPSPLPYSSLIQDLRTGLKIHQLCVGEYDNGVNTPKLPFRKRDIVLAGKIGAMRYVHKLDGQDFMRIQSSGIETSGGGFIDKTGDDVSGRSEDPGAAAGVGVGVDFEQQQQRQLLERPRSAGFATLRVWFDSWKALGIWSQDAPNITLTKVLTDATILAGPMLGVPQLAGVHGDTLYIQVPMLIEVDRPTTIVLQAQSIFSGHKLRQEMFDVEPKRPQILVIGPLEAYDRYNVHLTGLKASPANDFVIDTFLHENETNVAVINCAPLIGETAGAQLLNDLANRCKVPFSGLSCVVHTNFMPNFDAILNDFRYSVTLGEQLREAKETGRLRESFRGELESIIDVFREVYRTFLSKPSYSELLLHGYHLLIQNDYSGFTDKLESYEGSDLELIIKLIVLIVARLNQEYFDRWVCPKVNVYRALLVGADRIQAYGAFLQREAEELGVPKKPDLDEANQTYRTLLQNDHTIKKYEQQEFPEEVLLEWFDPDVSAVEMIFKQWVNDFQPAPYKWIPWVSLNGKVSIEQVRSVTEANLPAISTQLEKAPLESGTRLIIVNDMQTNQESVDELIEGESMVGTQFQDLLRDWRFSSKDRELCVICPSTKYGCRKLDVASLKHPPPPPEEDDPVKKYMLKKKAEEEGPPPPLPEIEKVFTHVYSLDTIYRSNEFKRLQTQGEKDKELAEKAKDSKRKNSAAAAKSKRAQRQREEEERKRREEVEAEVAALKAAQIPDGFFVIACATTSYKSSEFESIVTNPPRISIIGDFIGSEQEKEEMYDDLVDGLPTAYDFIQLPHWFQQFCPATESIFVEDEVLLLMRQHAASKAVLSQLEAGDYIPAIMSMYEKSRLSELSRPEDLREVDMTLPGVIPMFFRDLVRKIWNADAVVPSEAKELMFPLTDDFIMSYCFSRSLADGSAMKSSLLFAQAVQNALMLSVSLKSAQSMSRLQRYENILKKHQVSVEKVKAMEDKEFSVREEKIMAEFEVEATRDAWRRANPEVAAERERAAKEEADTEALRQKMERDLMTPAERAKLESSEKALGDIQKEVELALSVVDINYDSDLDAIADDQARDAKMQRKIEFAESIKQKEQDDLLASVKMFTAEREERVAAEKSTKKKPAADQEEKPKGAEGEGEEEGDGGEFDAAAMKELEKQRSEWLVAALEVVMEVVAEKELLVASEAATKALWEECMQEVLEKREGMLEDEKLAHAKLQIQRVRSENTKLRRVYGKRVAFMA